MARAGHVSVTVDRLGYGASGHPPTASSVCIGSQADVAHQIVQAAEGRVATRSQGGKPREVQAGRARRPLRRRADRRSSRPTPTGTERARRRRLLVLEPAARATIEFGFQRIACDKGGDPVGPGCRPDYAFFGRTAAGFRSTMFRSAPEGGPGRGGQAALPRPVRRQLLADRHDPEAGGQRRARSRSRCWSPAAATTSSTRRSAARRRRSASQKGAASLILKNTGHGVPLERRREDVPRSGSAASSTGPGF